jgi:peptide/nickel transport system substrate-binding protein
MREREVKRGIDSRLAQANSGANDNQGKRGMAAALLRAMLGVVIVLALGAAAPAKTFRWANDVDLTTLDPYAHREIFHQSFLASIYEPLVRRGRDLALEPALAVAWSQPSPLVWRFTLRPGVRFQDGSPLSAEDVVFSFARAESPASHLASLLAPIRDVRKLDERTVEIVTLRPDPILLEEIAGWPIMSKAWCEAHPEEGYAATHANGTGPYRLVERLPGERTVLAPNSFWWDNPADLPDVVFTPIADPEARVEALLAGELDLLYAVPPESVDRLAQARGVRILHGPGLRTIYLGFDQTRPKLNDLPGNPFKDRRVRRAIYEAIDEGTIVAKVMRGYATPAGLIVAPGINGFDAAMNGRLPYDPAAARRDLAEAGWGQGFAVPMDCPNDRYLNDEAICEEVAAMLMKIGVAVDLHVAPRTRFFAKLLDTRIGSSFYLMGWTPATYDAQAALINLAATRDGDAHAGEFNIGGYSNPALDALLGRIAVETDGVRRLSLLREALGLVKDDVVYVPLHQQAVVWAVREGVDLVQPADDGIALRYVQVP